jgi:hypothetical protein
VGNKSLAKRDFTCSYKELSGGGGRRTLSVHVNTFFFHPNGGIGMSGFEHTVDHVSTEQFGIERPVQMLPEKGRVSDRFQSELIIFKSRITVL